MIKDDFDITIPISLYNQLLICWNEHNTDVKNCEPSVDDLLEKQWNISPIAGKSYYD